MNHVRALIVASHPGPSLAITAMVALLTAQARPGLGPVLVAPAILAGQLSVGWSNDAFDATRDAAAAGRISPLLRRYQPPGPSGSRPSSLHRRAGVVPRDRRAHLVIRGDVAAAWAYNAG